MAPAFGPVKQPDLIYYLRKAGFDGPFAGGKHPYMLKGDLTIVIPNPHKGDISRNFLTRILRQAKISRKEWEAL